MNDAGNTSFPETPQKRPSGDGLCTFFKNGRSRQVFMIFTPAGRFLTGPLPPGDLAARFFAAVILPPLLILAM